MTASGERTRTLVWICEYPYRTMRMDGPCADCDGCPLTEVRNEARFLARLATDAVTH